MHTTRTEEAAEEAALRNLEEAVFGMLNAQIEAGESAVLDADVETLVSSAVTSIKRRVPVAAGSAMPSGSTRTTIRLPSHLIVQIRREASRRGIRYQTLLKLILQEAATHW